MLSFVHFPSKRKIISKITASERRRKMWEYQVKENDFSTHEKKKKKKKRKQKKKLFFCLCGMRPQPCSQCLEITFNICYINYILTVVIERIKQNYDDDDDENRNKIGIFERKIKFILMFQTSDVVK